jgi:hypothetical protein
MSTQHHKYDLFCWNVVVFAQVNWQEKALELSQELQLEEGHVQRPDTVTFLDFLNVLCANICSKVSGMLSLNR